MSRRRSECVEHLLKSIGNEIGGNGLRVKVRRRTRKWDRMKGVWTWITWAKYERAEGTGPRGAGEMVPSREGKKEEELANGERSDVERVCEDVLDAEEVDNGVAQAPGAR